MCLPMAEGKTQRSLAWKGDTADVRFVFTVPRQTTTVVAGYARILKLLAAMRPYLSGVQWYFSPLPTATRQTWISVQDRPRVLTRYGQTCGHMDFNAVLIREADESAGHLKTGRCVLTFAPGLGELSLETIRPARAWPERDLTTMMRGILHAIVKTEPVTFASLDVKHNRHAAGRGYPNAYSMHFRAFSERHYLGWMGFVPKVLQHDDVPSAADVIPVPERHGSLVVAVRDRFDLRNHHHIEQARRVERRLAELDALPLIASRISETATP